MLDYTGKTFDKVNGSIYTITGVKGKYKNSRSRGFVVECSFCSKDKELWPSGSIHGLIKQVSGNNTYLCGCSRNVHWTEIQQILRIKRECNKRGYVFKGFSEDFKGSLTKIILYNPQTQRLWDTTNIHNFLQGKGDYVHENILNVVGNLEDTLEILQTVDGYDDRIFCKESAKNNLKYYCYRCNTVAKISIDRYLKGIQSCKCGRIRLNYNEKDDKYINTFKSIVEEIISIKGDAVKYRCKNCSKVAKSSYNKVYLEYPRVFCKNCGFSSDYGEGDLDNETDYLYLVDFETYSKVGRSLKPLSRLNTLCKRNKSIVRKLYIWEGLHKDVKMLEVALINKIKMLKNNVNSFNIKDGKTECFPSSEFYNFKDHIEEVKDEYHVH